MKIMGTCLAVLLMMAPAAAAEPAALAAADNARMATAGGLVMSIDTATKSLVVTLDELKEGDKVTVTYRAQSGRNVVVNIGVESKT